MAKKQKYPKELYVVYEETSAGEADFLRAEEDTSSLTETDGKRQVAVYEYKGLITLVNETRIVK